MPDGFTFTTTPAATASPGRRVRRLLAALRGLDAYVGRSWPGDPSFRIVREPGSLELNAFGRLVIVSWAPVKGTAS